MEINRDHRQKVSPHRYNTNDKSPYRPDRETRPYQAEINHLLRDFTQSDSTFVQKIDTITKLYQQSLSQLQEQKSTKAHSSNQSLKSRGLDKNFLSHKSVESSNYLNSRHITSSPNKDKVRDSLARIQNSNYDDSKDLRYICKKIFEFYSSLGDRLNTEHLKLSKFHRFANDACIVDKRLNDQILDVLFKKYAQNQGSINFEQFLVLLVEMAISYNKGLSKKEAFAQFFHTYIKPLYAKLYSQTDLGECDIIFREPVQKDTCKILKSVASAFALLHHHYFPSEYQKSSKSEYETKCEHYMPNFLRDFAICPNLLPFGAAHSVLREILNQSHQQILNSLARPFELPRNSGGEFTLLKFLVYIVRLAMVLSSQQYGDNIFDENGEIMQKDMLLVLLQRMEMSSGLAKFREYVSATNHTSFSVWPKELMENLTMANQLETKSMESYSNQFSSRKSRRGLEDRTPSFANLKAQLSIGRGRTSGRSTQRYGTPSPLRTQRETSARKEEINQAFEENSEILQVIFKAFCSFTGGSETSRVKNMSLIKLFKDAGLVKDISKGDEYNSLLQTQARKTGTTEEVSFTTIMTKKRRLNPSELDTFFREQFYLSSTTKNSPNNKSVERRSSPERTSRTPRADREKSFFDVFLKAIEFVAYNAYPNLELHEAISHVITQDLAGVLEEKKTVNMKMNTQANFKMLCSILDDFSIIDVLGRLKKAVHYFYRAYCRQNNLMTSEEFLTFCRNFKILPMVVSREKLLEIFQTLAPLCPIMSSQTRDNQNEQVLEGKEHGNIDGLVIDENLFVEAIALSAANIDLSGLSTKIMNKLLFLIEKIREGASSSVNQRIVQALELQKSQKELGEVVSYIKGKYWDLIQKGAGTNKDKINNFDDIFA